jgi:hypothetical protein
VHTTFTLPLLFPFDMYTHTHYLSTLSPHTHTQSLIHFNVSHTQTNSPRSDTCNTCDSLNVRINAQTDPAVKASLQLELYIHHRQAERARQALREDSSAAKSSADVITISFVLEQTLPTPLLTTNVCYYKRQLFVYNMGIHDCGMDKGFMYMWDESASRGSMEVGSCIRKHLSTQRSSTSKHLFAYSDSCGGHLSMHMVTHSRK